MQATETKTDFTFAVCGSIAYLTPMSAEAHQWVLDEVQPEPWQWQGGSLAMEPRYFPAIHAALADEGLTVEAEG